MFQRIILAATLASVPALSSAAVMDVTLTGTLLREGSFGTVYDLNGTVWGGAATPTATFTATLTYDTSLGNYSSYPGSFGSTQYVLEGGEGYSPPVAGPVSASFTIGSVTRSVTGEEQGIAIVNPGGAENSYEGIVDFARYDARDQDISGVTFTFGQIAVDLYALGGTIPSSLTTPYEILFDRAAYIDQTTGLNATGFAYFAQYDENGTDFTFAYDSYVNFFADSVKVTCRSGCDPVPPPPAPIPLPASALLLLAGVGSIGLLRRRRRAV